MVAWEVAAPDEAVRGGWGDLPLVEVAVAAVLRDLGRSCGDCAWAGCAGGDFAAVGADERCDDRAVLSPPTPPTAAPAAPPLVDRDVRWAVPDCCCCCWRAWLRLSRFSVRLVPRSRLARC
jgi:hypothetical protein